MDLTETTIERQRQLGNPLVDMSDEIFGGTPTSFELYDRDGRPVSFRVHMILFSDDDYRQVAFDRAAGATISTVWLGHGVHTSFDGTRMLFETMVSGGDGDQFHRWATEADALAGHQHVVRELVAATN